MNKLNLEQVHNSQNDYGPITGTLRISTLNTAKTEWKEKHDALYEL